MKRKILTLLTIFILLTLILNGSVQAVEDQLRMYDQQVYYQFTIFYPRDARYDAYLTEIASRLNANIVDVFGEDKDIIFYVCPSHLGFNAVSFHRVIIFDSLLLDSLRYLAMGKVYYGSIDNQYVDQLAHRVAQVSQYHRMGSFVTNPSDTYNPFGLPGLGPLNPAQQLKAEELFKEMLASWMCHEGSHCMLDHMKFRLKAMSEQQQQFNYQGDMNQFNNSMNVYAQAQISQQLEKEADVIAARWLLASGYSIEGFTAWLYFAQKLETIMGMDNAYIRTHPSSAQRIRYIKDAAAQFRRR